jgi:hypothetical protein
MAMGDVGCARKPEVTIAIDSLKQEVEKCYQELLGLEERLKSILKPNNPTPSLDETKKEIAIVPLASEIRNQVYAITNIYSLIRRLKDRMEI